jgi:predicted kinase
LDGRADIGGVGGLTGPARPGRVTPVSRVVFMCGPSGSGKTRYAKRLEAQGMVRLSFDVVMWERGITTVPLPQELRHEIETELRRRLVELVDAGQDVVLDFSFWSRGMRADYRRLLEPTGVIPETIYLSTDRATVLERVRARRGTHADDFELTEELAARYFDHFEPPSAEEGPLTIVGD